MSAKKTKGTEPPDETEFFEKVTLYLARGNTRDENKKRARLLGYKSDGVMIAPGAVVNVRAQENIGRNVYIGLYCYVNGDVTLEDNVLIGLHSTLPAGNHKFCAEKGWFSGRTEPDGDESIVVGKGSWLAANVTVTGGVHIGCCNLICAGSVVTRSTPDYAIMAGAPAKQIGAIDPVTGEYHWYK